MSYSEYCITNILADLDLTPKIHDITGNGDGKYYVRSQKYPMTLIDLCNHSQPSEYLPLIDAIIDRLHSIGIFHGNLHPNKIVIDPSSKDIRIVDFESSDWINNITKMELRLLHRKFGSTTVFRTITDIFNYEKSVFNSETSNLTNLTSTQELSDMNIIDDLQ